MNPTTLESLRAKGEHFQLIDVRSPQEYAEAHVPGAMNLPMEQAEARLGDLSSRDTVVLICQSGRRAGMTCTLVKPHRSNVVVLEGGTDAWIQAGLPVVTTRATRLSLLRQMQTAAGSLIILGTLLTLLVSPFWSGLVMFIGGGLFIAGTTGYCGATSVMEKMPWNRPVKAN